MDEFIHGISGSVSGLISVSVWYPLETIRMRLQQRYLEDQNKRKKENDSDQTDKVENNSKKENSNNTNKIIDEKDESSNTKRVNQTTNGGETTEDSKAKIHTKEKKDSDGKEDSGKEKGPSQKDKDYLEESLIFQSWVAFKKIIKEEGVRGLYSGISSCLFGSVVCYFIYFFMYQYWKNFFVKHNLSVNVVFDSLCTSFLGALCTSVITNPIWVLNARMSQTKAKVIFNIKTILIFFDYILLFYFES